MPRVDRLTLVQGAFALFALALVAKSAKVQLVDAPTWRERARRQQMAAAPLPARRGEVRDAGGDLLVESRELVALALAPLEVLGPVKPGAPRREAALARLRQLAAGLSALGVDSAVIAKATDTTRKWVEVPGRFLPTEAAPLAKLPGVQVTPVLDRVPPGSEGLRRLVGRVGADHRAVDGIELALDSLLQGSQGSATLVRDGRGGRYPSPGTDGTAPRPGHTVVLTIHRGLQEIAERALADAVARSGAHGGDVVVLDPRTGEVRAMASRRADPRSTAATALTEPFEPGSTLKPFIAAALLDRRRARTDEVVPTFGGRWTVNRRTITDVHRADRLSLADVIRFSSNIGIVQFAARLAPREQYELYRDLGFGMPTGVPYPSEAAGLLRPPARWSSQSQASLAMGYELSVTPLQLVTAYAAIANGGELVQPGLVKEVRTADGRVVYRHDRRVVRRVMSPEAARAARVMLQAVVDSGTATDASLSTFDVAGKSGTARRTSGRRGYASGSYTATFVGMFPAEQPQYVVLAKLDDPDGTYYGGKVAAPVARAVLEGALALRDAALDRRVLVDAEHAPRPAAGAVRRPAAALVAAAVSASAPAIPASDPTTLPASGLPAATRAAAPGRPDAEPVVTESAGSVPYLWTVGTRRTPRALIARRPVPDVAGLPTRHAVRALHRAGFRVAIDDGAGQRPAGGTIAPEGTVVQLGRRP